MKKIWTKVGQTTDRQTKYFGKPYVICVANEHQLPSLFEDANNVLLKDQKNVLKRWKEYFCKLLNPVTVQHLEISEEQLV